MDFFVQLKSRRIQIRRSIKEIVKLTGIAAPNLSALLNGKRDARAATLHAIGDALDAHWVLVPRHLLPEVERVLSGKVIGTADVPSTAERLFNQVKDD